MQHTKTQEVSTPVEHKKNTKTIEGIETVEVNGKLFMVLWDGKEPFYVDVKKECKIATKHIEETSDTFNYV